MNLYTKRNDGTVWPNPDTEIGREARYCHSMGSGGMDERKMMWLASVADAYAKLCSMTQKELIEWNRVNKETP